MVKTPERRMEPYQLGRMPPSPCGATPRPPLRQQYPKVSFFSESQQSTTNEDDYRRIKRSTTTSYTALRTSNNGTDSVDYDSMDYDSVPAERGSSSKSLIILAVIFFLSLLAVGWYYSRVAEIKE